MWTSIKYIATNYPQTVVAGIACVVVVAPVGTPDTDDDRPRASALTFFEE